MGSIAVLGPGGVGGFLGAALARAGEDVLVIARESTAALIAANGIAVRSVRLGDFVAHPRAAPELDAPADVLLVATKATGLHPALERVQAEPKLVVPLLNGVDHMARLRSWFGAHRVAAGVIRVEADCPAPGQIVQTSPFLRVDLAADDPVLAPRVGALARALLDAEVPTLIGPGEAQILWSKLVRLNALASTTSAADRPIGFIRTDPEWREALIGCVHETAAVANADGAEIDPVDTLAELDDAHAELDAIAGAVLRAGARHGLACPTVERLAGMVAERAGISRPGG